MRRTWAASLAALALGAAAAACGTSGTSTSTASSSTGGTRLSVPGGNAGGGPIAQQAGSVAKTSLTGPTGSGLTRGVTSNRIDVGCVDTKSDYTGYEAGIRAEISAVNKAGGVAGRTINLIPCLDDAGTVQTNVQDSQQLVNQNNVFAVLSLSQFALPPSNNFLNQNQVPYIGWGFNQGFCGYRWGFGWNGCLGGSGIPGPYEAIAGNLAQAILKANNLDPKTVRFAVEGVNAPSGQIGNTQYTSLFTTLGAKVVYNQANFPSSSAGVDVTPYVQAILASHPNVIYLSTPFNGVAPLAAGLRAAGYNGIIMDFTNYVPGLLQASSQLASALQGESINTQVVPGDPVTPYVTQVEDQLAATGQPRILTLGGAMGYAEADTLVGMLQAVGKDLNTKTFDQKINGGNFVSYTADPPGGPGKLQWPAAHYLPADCAAIVKVSGTNYTTVQPFSCYDSFKVG
jgi:branched-chain amino acid transport system substrate-binding protein